ncbi:MAG: hypothetical protein EOP49_18765, partial [Sphingobacteriales bacterium]
MIPSSEKTIGYRKCYLLVFVLLVVQGFARAQRDQLVAGSAVTVNGFVGSKLNNAAVNRVFAQDVNRLVEPFRHRDEARCWQTEFWGKWFTSAILAYKYQPTAASKQILDKAVADLISTQTTDGYIGNYKTANLLDQWDIWGRKYCLLGLLDYYDITRDKKTLQAASALADNLLSDLASRGDTIVTKGNHRGMAASSVLEPLCLLYTRTANKKYLDAAIKSANWYLKEGVNNGFFLGVCGDARYICDFATAQTARCCVGCSSSCCRTSPCVP